MIGIAAGVVAILAVAGVMLLTGGPPPAGAIVVDAAPWATVTSIQTDGGDAMSIPTPASTPLVLTLPEGTYRVALAGPAGGSQSQEVTITIVAGQTSVAPLVRFTTMTPESYFEEYLASPGAAEEPASPTAPGEPALLAPAAPSGAAQ